MSRTRPPPISRPLAKRLQRRVGRVVTSLTILFIIGCIVENYRGIYLWKKYRKQWEAKGEQFDLMKLVPSPVPQDQNFATTPFFAPYLDYTIDGTNRAEPRHWRDKKLYELNKAVAANLGDLKSERKKSPDTAQWQIGAFEDLRRWQDYFDGNTNFPFAASRKDPASDVLTALRRYNPVLDELQAASARPYSRFPVHYEEHLQTLLPHLASVKNLAQVVRLRALAYLEAGLPAEALRDMEFSLRLAEALKSEHLLISQLVRLAISDLALQPVWEGLARNRWNEVQIAELQSSLARNNVLEDYAPTMRMERAISIYFIDEFRTGHYRDLTPGVAADDKPPENYSIIRYLPSGAFRRNQLAIARAFQEHLIPQVNLEQHHLGARELEEVGPARGFGLYRLFSDLLIPAESRASHRFGRAQAGLDLALVACALERYRLVNGRYPGALEALTPKFLAKIPPDVITGKSLKYHLTGDGRFVLYSVGWNETDDNGVPGLTERQKRFDPEKGDWVWSYPAVASEPRR